MFELSSYIVIGFVIFITLWALWRYLSRRSEDHEAHTNNRAFRSREYEQYDSSDVMRHPPDTTYSWSSRKAHGSSSKDSEIEDIQIRLSNIERMIRYLQDDLRHLAREREANAPPSPNIGHDRQDQFSREERVITQSFNTSRESEEVLRNACGAYQKLSTEGLRGLPIEPLFALLDMESSARGSAIGETKRNFKQSDNKQSAFVIFRNNPTAGWIFPNPRISFTEAMKYVFPNLSYENFEEAKNRVDPKRVRATSEGAWETVVD
jgi:hypothetical protein